MELRHRTQREADRVAESIEKAVQGRCGIDVQLSPLDVEPSCTKTGGGVSINVCCSNVLVIMLPVGALAVLAEISVQLGLNKYSGPAVTV